MMKNKLKLLLVVGAGLLLANCSSTTYKIKSENSKVVNSVPKWYMADFSENKACDLKIFDKKDDDKQCIFGAGTAVSPDLIIIQSLLPPSLSWLDNLLLLTESGLSLAISSNFPNFIIIITSLKY